MVVTKRRTEKCIVGIGSSPGKTMWYMKQIGVARVVSVKQDIAKAGN